MKTYIMYPKQPISGHPFIAASVYVSFFFGFCFVRKQKYKRIKII